MEREIVTALGDSTVTDLLGDRVYLSVAPEGVESPYCRFFEVVGVHAKTLAGVAQLKRVRYQFDFFGPDTDVLIAASKAVLARLKVALTVSEASTRSPHTGEQDQFHRILDVSIWS